ncbi:hypothetical protein PG988_006468 [Apiospora saccharicola]
MEILKLPSELIHEILYWVALARDVKHSVKRTLRLRLVCKYFAEAVYPALFRTHRLDDAMYHCCFGDVQYKESRHGTRDLWHRYLVYRVTGEQNANLGRFVETKWLAEALSAFRDSPDKQTIVETLCWLALDNIQRGPCSFGEKLQDNAIPDQGQTYLAAAVRLNMPSLVGLMLRGGSDPTQPDFLFPPATQVAAE